MELISTPDSVAILLGDRAAEDARVIAIGPSCQQLVRRVFSVAQHHFETMAESAICLWVFPW